MASTLSKQFCPVQGQNVSHASLLLHANFILYHLGLQTYVALMLKNLYQSNSYDYYTNYSWVTAIQLKITVGKHIILAISLRCKDFFVFFIVFLCPHAFIQSMIMSGTVCSVFRLRCMSIKIYDLIVNENHPTLFSQFLVSRY